MTGEQEARILSVRPLALYIASRMPRTPPLDIEDLAQAGLAQLCSVIDAYDECRAFGSWAGTIMGNAMRRENQSMTWRRQSKIPIVRSLYASGSISLMIEHGHAHAIEGDSGRADAPHRNAERPATLSRNEGGGPPAPSVGLLRGV